MRTTAPRQQHDAPFATLFEGDDKLLSDAQLEEILGARVHIPEWTRIAILEFDQPQQLRCRPRQQMLEPTGRFSSQQSLVQTRTLY